MARAGNCEGAIAEFEASYKLFQRPSTLYNIAQCHETLFRYDLAVRNYERYMAVAPADDPDRQAVEAKMSSLRNLLATIEIETNVENAEVWIGDRKAGVAPGFVLIPSGRHTLELRAEGYIPGKREIQVAGQQQLKVTLNLETTKTVQKIEKKVSVTKIEKSKGLSPVFFWVGVGATVATAGAGAFFGLRALSLKSDAEQIDARIPRDEEADDIDNAALLADIFFISSGLLAAGTVVLFFLTDWDGDEEKLPTKEKQATARLAPIISPDILGLSLQGTL